MPDNNNPWGNRGRKPSDLDDLIQDGIKKLVKSLKGRSKPPGGGEDNKPEGNGKSWIIILIAAVIYLLFQSIFQIQPGEQGVVLRFGRYHHISSPGLNFKYPLVEKIIKVDVETIRKEEFGSKRSVGNRERLGASSSLMDLESLMITSDKNVVQLNWVVQYKVRDPENFLFNIENPRAAVRDISETVIRRLVGNRDFDYVLNNRNELAVSSRMEMQELLDKYNSGIQIVVVQLQDVNPPDAVRPSFDEVNEAEQDKIRLGNEAQKEVNQILPRAEGEAKQTIEKAQGYAIERVNIAKGDVARFNSIYKEYRLAKKVTRTRMYIETLTESLPKLKEVIVVDQSNNGVLPLLHLGGTVGGTTVTTPAK